MFRFVACGGLNIFTKYSSNSDSKLPKDGINVFAVYIHAHTLGRKIVGRHFRNGTELEPLVVDNHYDFNFQVCSMQIAFRTLFK